MKHLLFSICFLLLVSSQAFSQQTHFVYLQTENREPFYVTLNKKNYSSSPIGYIIIPKLQNGEYNIKVGFAKNGGAEQDYILQVKDNEQGYLIKDFAEKGWALFNLQTLDLQYAGQLNKQRSSLAMAAQADAKRKEEEQAAIDLKEKEAALAAESKRKAEELAATEEKEKDAAKTAENKRKADELIMAAQKEKEAIAAAEKKKADEQAAIEQKQKELAIATEQKKADEKATTNEKQNAGENAGEAKKIADERAALETREKEATIIAAAKKQAEEVAAAAEAKRKADEVSLANAKAIAAKEAAENAALKEAEQVAKASKGVVTESGVPVFIKQTKTEGGMVYKYAVTDHDGKDTINVFIKDGLPLEVPGNSQQKPLATNVDTDIKKDTVKFLNMEFKQDSTKPETTLIEPVFNKTITPSVPENVKTEVKKSDSITAVAEKKVAITIPKWDNNVRIDSTVKQLASGAIPYTNCLAEADEKDFFTLRKKMAAENGADEMVLVAKKAMKEKCYSTTQVRNLSVLFLNDADRYQFLDAAYPFTHDAYQYDNLMNLLYDSYYIQRFKAMIRK